MDEAEAEAVKRGDLKMDHLSYQMVHFSGSDIILTI